MKDMDKTKAELIQELEEIRQQHNCLQAEYNREKSEYEKEIDDLKITLEKADAKSYSLSKIFQNYTHEFRAPLGGLLGHTDVLKDFFETNEEQKEYLEIIASSNKSLLQILNMGIDHCRLELGLTTIDLTETAINELTSGVFSAYMQMAKSKGIDFKYVYPLSFNEFIIKTDFLILSRTFHILINCILESLNNGSFELGYSLMRGSTNIVEEPVNPYVLEFFVKGKGNWQSDYDPIDLSTYFNNTSDKFGSWHLNNELSLVKPYIKLLGGKIWAQNGEGNSLSVYFTIPYMHNENLSQDASNN